MSNYKCLQCFDSGCSCGGIGLSCHGCCTCDANKSIPSQMSCDNCYHNSIKPNYGTCKYCDGGKYGRFEEWEEK